MNIIDPVLVVAIPIILSFIYIQLVSGFLSDVFIARITKASFKIASSNIVDLWIGYVLGMLVFVYIVHQFVKYNVVDIDPSSRVIVIIIGLTLLYIGRIITKEKGIFYGKLHFSSLFILGSIFFVLNSIIMLKGLSVASIMDYNYNLTDISLNFLNRIKDTLIFFQSFITYMFIGTIMLSTVGEYILYSFAHEQPRSLLAVSEKFPSDFRVITGKRGIGNKSNEMVGEDKDIISLRCVTKSCTMVRDIEKCIYRQYEKNREKEEEQENTTLDYRIIKAPWERVIEDFNKSANTIPFSLGSIFRIIRGENYAKKYKEEYERRLKILAKLEDKGKVKVKDFYFGDIRFLIVVDSSGDKKLLFSARDGGPMMDRVGLYTEEPYIVESFANLFDTTWRKTNNLF